MAPRLGPETLDWLNSRDPGVAHIDDAIRLESDMVAQVMLRVLRWFQILQDKAEALKSEGGTNTQATTVSVDAVELLDDLSEIAEVGVILPSLTKRVRTVLHRFILRTFHC